MIVEGLALDIRFKRFVGVGFSMLLAGLLVMAGIQNISLILKAGSGYAAKNICSGYFLSGFAPELVIEQALSGVSPILKNVSFEIDEHAGLVTTRLYGMFPRRAVFTQGIGCTLTSVNETKIEFSTQALKRQLVTPQASWEPVTDSVFDEAGLMIAMDAAFAENHADGPRNTKAIVVVHDGKLVAERYAEGVDTDTPLLGWSMTKSVPGLLIGLLVKDGLLDIHAPAPVPQWQHSPDDKRRIISSHHLLQMNSGLMYNEDYGVRSDVTQMLSNQSDMAGFAASKPLESEIGELWSYSSGTSNILAGIIRNLVGGSVRDAYDFSYKRLFEPIGIKTATMEVDASGTFVGSSYMYASARDWARLGLLCLNDGVWDGQQILPADWMTYSTTPASANPANNYGAHFWLNLPSGDGSGSQVFPELPADSFAMDGYQGQLVVIIPSEDLVVVRMGFTPGGNHGVEKFIAAVIAAKLDPTELTD